ncbi:hypothetical protein ANCDUO_10742 [Ancylostoma duodenale]|uniref:Uncharacterized protein n=1 Tax=Ancylostoma duodenale TaxID=51022 RepID=A0A0C2CQJ2_9BILA|nr:hypothetical protein ANCDUO_10742 [Ancylostoma duodenale]
MALGDPVAVSGDISEQIADAMRDVEVDESQQAAGDVFFDTQSPGIKRKSSKSKTAVDEEDLDFDDFR